MFFREEAENYSCPVCKSKLIWGEGERRYETLVEHVSDPNGYVCAKPYLVCSNDKCKTRTEYNDFWDDYGEYYSSHKEGESYSFERYPGVKFKEAIGSHALEFSTSHHDYGENFTFLHLYYFRFRIHYEYEADNLGNITKKIRKVKILKRDGLRGDSVGWIYVSPGFNMVSFLKREFAGKVEKYELDPSTYNRDNVLECFERPKWDKRWWRFVFVFWVNRKHKNIKLAILAEKALLRR